MCTCNWYFYIQSPFTDAPAYPCCPSPVGLPPTPLRRANLPNVILRQRSPSILTTPAISAMVHPAKEDCHESLSCPANPRLPATIREWPRLSACPRFRLLAGRSFARGAVPRGCDPAIRQGPLLRQHPHDHRVRPRRIPLAAAGQEIRPRELVGIPRSSRTASAAEIERQGIARRFRLARWPCRPSETMPTRRLSCDSGPAAGGSAGRSSSVPRRPTVS